MRAFRPGHARSNGRENKNAFQAFAKYQDANIKERNRRRGVWLHRIGRPMHSNPLPDDHRDHENRGGENSDNKNGPKRRPS